MFLPEEEPKSTCVVEYERESKLSDITDMAKREECGGRRCENVEKDVAWQLWKVGWKWVARRKCLYYSNISPLPDRHLSS